MEAIPYRRGHNRTSAALHDSSYIIYLGGWTPLAAQNKVPYGSELDGPDAMTMS